MVAPDLTPIEIHIVTKYVVVDRVLPCGAPSGFMTGDAPLLTQGGVSYGVPIQAVYPPSANAVAAPEIDVGEAHIALAMLALILILCGLFEERK